MVDHHERGAEDVIPSAVEPEEPRAAAVFAPW